MAASRSWFERALDAEQFGTLSQSHVNGNDDDRTEAKARATERSSSTYATTCGESCVGMWLGLSVRRGRRCQLEVERHACAGALVPVVRVSKRGHGFGFGWKRLKVFHALDLPKRETTHEARLMRTLTLLFIYLVGNDDRMQIDCYCARVASEPGFACGGPFCKCWRHCRSSI